MSQLVVGNYTLGELLGRGGMSDVYAAQHRFLGDAVAVKLVRGGVDGDPAIDALVAEAAGTRAIQHRNVVRVLDVGRDPRTGRCYLVMERVAGENLAARLRRVGRLDEAAVRALGAAIADGMEAAHARGIVHRDLKPANVMLDGDDPKIVDFGIAKHLGDASAVTTGRRIGTPAYMAPEQFTGGVISPAVDIWALGVILFEALTGTLPFEGFDDGRCPQLFEPPRRASGLAPISPALEHLLERCLTREPGRRPRSMSEVAAALRGERLTQDAPLERVTQDAPLPVPIAPNEWRSHESREDAHGPSTRREDAARSGQSGEARRRWVTVATAAVVIAAAIGIAVFAFGGDDDSDAPRSPAGETVAPATAPATGTGTGTGTETETETGTGTGTETGTETETETGTETETETETATGTETVVETRPTIGVKRRAGGKSRATKPRRTKPATTSSGEGLD